MLLKDTLLKMLQRMFEVCLLVCVCVRANRKTAPAIYHLGLHHHGDVCVLRDSGLQAG